MSTFKKLGLSDEILKVLTELEFKEPTEIQKKAIPRLLTEDKDMIGLAQTGTGKTAAFGLPLLEKIDQDIDNTQALILAPTRELGKQIAEQLSIFAKYMDGIALLPVYGGAPISKQIKSLKKTRHIIIATPGRLIDLINRKAINLEEIRFLVLDEADEMLNMGFQDELEEILKHTPDHKNTWLFSATMPSTIKKMVKRYMDNPIDVRINPKNSVNTDIEHLFATVKRKDKEEALCRFMDLNAETRAIVFCRTKLGTQALAESLLAKSYKADALHGDLSQAQRDRVMRRFKNNELNVLIATDVAARGIDVNDITHVYHFDLPDDNVYYTHRSGRTARAGKKGASISFIGGKDAYKIKKLERELGIDFGKIEVPDADAVLETRIQSWCMGILDKKTKNKVDAKLLDYSLLLFGKLSKEELVAKILTIELEKLNIAEGNLNDTEKGRDRDRGGKRGSYGSKRRSGGGQRNSSKRGYDKKRKGPKSSSRRKKKRY